MTGTQLQSLTTHEADVLCLCVTEGQTEIFASGCDGKVYKYLLTYGTMIVTMDPTTVLLYVIRVNLL